MNSTIRPQVAPPPEPATAREKAVAIDRVAVPKTDRFEVEAIGPPLAAPWSVAFLPDGAFLITEKHGGIRIIQPDGRTSPPLGGGPPNVLAKVDSGLLDVALDPDFLTNRIIYVVFAEGTEKSNRTAVWKSRLDADRLTGGRVIFRVNETKKEPSHPGGRLLFLPDKTFLLTVGDGYDYREKAQDPASHLGKILRLTRDGGVPPDNPFVGRPVYAPEIWTLGHRNPQGLTRDPVTGRIWEHEHGPRGGDEINILVAGGNYGWPRVSFGIDYDGKLITERQHLDGMIDPRFVWSPSIAPSGLAIYRGSVHPGLDGRLLVGGLVSRSLIQVAVGAQRGLLAEQGRWLGGLKARIRDVRVGPGGQVYLLTDDSPGQLLRLVQANDQLLPAESALAPLGFLLGSWTGTSTFIPASATKATLREESSTIDCDPILKGTYIQCTARFFRKTDGGLRMIQYNLHKDPASKGFEVSMVDSDWSGQHRYKLDWSAAEKAWVGFLPTEQNGKPATKRIVKKLSLDGKTLRHTESLRPDPPPGEWQETFRWVWTRR